ncbi:hypothetical protein Poly30_09120 [Planctomycetes bacterium Poly30]|uniref:PEP-CTERM sorting domain-containing protein n=1 Tax=Saltatorellus ferox TaxID=2528018 RepID=A0A518EMV0_9BACT|nr:hypothetical protein Poly30_09120 [Planctomycetes bacterium Poly30]
MNRPIAPTVFQRSLAQGLLALAATSAVASAQSSSITAWSQTDAVGMHAVLRLSGAANAPFAVWSGLEQDAAFDFTQSTRVAGGRFNGLGTAEILIPLGATASMPANFGVELYLLTRKPGGFDAVGSWLPLMGQGGTLCQVFDPNYKLGVIEPVVGEVIANQWSAVNMTVSAVSSTNTVAVFDTANPSGGDTDLATPGYGFGNGAALGHVLVMPDALVHTNGDGLLENVSDDAAGGVMRFDFAEPYRMCSATILDIDDANFSELRFYIGDTMSLETIPLTNLGDNSLQTLTFDKRNVRRFELVLGGSGALARLGMVPCPLLVNLDENPFGAPRPEVAGDVLTGQYADLGVFFSAQNNVPFHPDALVLFDSENPTGGDFDLQTPGYGLGNTEALGLVLVIAENDIDAGGDGLIDDPDDEALGGRMLLEFTENVTFFSARVLDVDALERDVFTFFDEFGATLDVIDIGSLGDNSVQSIVPAAPIQNVRSIQINLTGSGALTRLRWCPSSNF